MIQPNEGQEKTEVPQFDERKASAFSRAGFEGNGLVQDFGEAGISTLDYACIHLKVPRTGKPWLDALITESLRNEMAGNGK